MVETMRVGIFGGSGLYDLGVFRLKERVTVPTPFGDPSDPFEIFEVNGREVVFLARHGKGHRLLPTEINYRANIWAMKILGVRWILSVSAVGSFRKEIQPTDIVLIDQFYDRTNQARKTTFFGEGLAAHISFANPICDELRRVVFEAGHEEGFGSKIHWGGTYLNIEGPAFSSRAESLLHKSWGFDVVGMTNIVEARLAREAEICYATLAMVTDYDSWVDDRDENLVTSDVVVESLRQNNETVRKIIAKAVVNIPEERRCACGSALQHAIATEREYVPQAVADKLDPIVGRYLRKN
jgi:5'-methylthioadenosine phosphorylase